MLWSYSAIREKNYGGSHNVHGLTSEVLCMSDRSFQVVQFNASWLVAVSECQEFWLEEDNVLRYMCLVSSPAKAKY